MLLAGLTCLSRTIKTDRTEVNSSQAVLKNSHSVSCELGRVINYQSGARFFPHPLVTPNTLSAK